MQIVKIQMVIIGIMIALRIIMTIIEANGTQGNKNATGGRYPDTEDLDRSGFLDKTNNYFTKTIPLDRIKIFCN